MRREGQVRPQDDTEPRTKGARGGEFLRCAIVQIQMSDLERGRAGHPTLSSQLPQNHGFEW